MVHRGCKALELIRKSLRTDEMPQCLEICALHDCVESLRCRSDGIIAVLTESTQYGIEKLSQSFVEGRKHIPD